MQTGRRYRPNRQPRGDGSDGGRGGSSGGRGRGRGRGGNGRLGQNDDGGNSTSATNTTTTNNQPTPSPSHPRALSHRNFQPSPSRLSRSVFQTRQPRPPRHNHPPVPPRSALVPGTTRVSIILKQDQSTGRQVQGVVEQILTRGDHPRGVKVRLRDGRVGRVQGVLGDGDGGEGTAGGAGVERVLGDEEESARGAVEGGQANQNQNGNSTVFVHGDMYHGEELRGRGGRRGRGRGGGGRATGAASRNQGPILGGTIQSSRSYHHVTDVRADPYTYTYEDESGSTGNHNNNLSAYVDAALQRMEALDLESATRIAGAAADMPIATATATATATCPVCGEFEGDEGAVGWHVGRVHFEGG